MPNFPEKGPFPYKFGYLPDLPDARDYTRDHPKIAPLLKTPSKVPSSIDLRPFCPPICDQGQLGSCTANAAAALLAFHNKRAYGKDTPPSRLFIYKATRDLMQVKGDTGGYIRTTMGSLALCGAPPEKYWNYDEKLLDSVPPAFCYSYAANYQALSYFRLDEKTEGTPTKNAATTLAEIKDTLASSLPVMFGFTVYESIKEASDGKIPYPKGGEAILGGHAVLAVGYDDELRIGECKGAFLIRNSWGEGWGEKGYGWLPYEYALAGLAQDWWCLVKAEWVSTEEFGV